MPLYDGSTKFIITLSAILCLNDTHVVLGEVTNGMHLLNAINKNGIRNFSRAHAVKLGKKVAAAGVIQNDIEIGGVGITDNETEVHDDIYYAQTSVIGARGVPVDRIIIYACGERD